MWTHDQVREDADRLDPAARNDPDQATALLNQATLPPEMVDVNTADIRALLWSDLDLAELQLLSEVRTFQSTQHRQLVKLAWTAVNICSSDRTLHADDAASWEKVVDGLSSLSQAGMISADNVQAVVALRTVTKKKYDPPLRPEDYRSIMGIE